MITLYKIRYRFHADHPWMEYTRTFQTPAELVRFLRVTVWQIIVVKLWEIEES